MGMWWWPVLPNKGISSARWRSAAATRTCRVITCATLRCCGASGAWPPRVKSAGVAMPITAPCASTTGSALMRCCANSGQACASGVAGVTVINWRDMMSPQRTCASLR